MSSRSSEELPPVQPGGGSPPPELKARILAAAKTEPAPPRAAWRRLALGTLLGGIAWMGAVFFGWMNGIIVQQRPPEHIVFMGAGWFLLAIGVTLLSATRGRSMLGRPGMLIGTTVGLLIPSLAAWALLGSWVWPETAALVCPTPETHLRCLRNAVLLGLGPFIGLLLMRRGTDPLHPRLTGLALGAAAGAWGSWAVGLHCPYTELGHVFLSHVLPTAVLGTLGLLAGPLVLAVRLRSSRAR
jgi:hypothetical protein